MNAAEELATQVAQTFGERPRWHGRELRVRCPVHEAEGAHNPSLAIWLGGDRRPKLKCMTGCSRDSVRLALRARGIAVHSGPTGVEALSAAVKAAQDARLESLWKAQSALANAVEVKPGDPVDVYLRSRQLSAPEKFWTVLFGWDPNVPNSSAMLAPIIDLTTVGGDSWEATAHGVASLALNADGTPRIEPRTGKKLRSIVGQQKGFAVPLGVPGPHLVVAEGIESALAAMRLLEIPFGCATLSANNMPGLAVPEWVTKVTIAADNDEPGLSAARHLRLSLFDGDLTQCGVAEVWGEPGSGWDAADEWMKRKG